mgnify:CR=1 FL=1
MTDCASCVVRNRAICASLNPEELLLLGKMGRKQRVKAGQTLLWDVTDSIHAAAKDKRIEAVVLELDDLQAFLAKGRELSPFLLDLMPTFASDASPMSMLRTSVSAASTHDPDGWDMGPEANARKALRLIAIMPTLITAYHRVREGLPLVAPDPTLGHAANFLHMLHGERPDPADAKILDTTFVLYADHTMNASTFTARVIASTLSDMFSAITGAIGALKGPLHGGANEEAMVMLEEVGGPSKAADYVAKRLAEKKKLMGFGHAVYRTMDPRARVLKALSRDLAARRGDAVLHETAEAVEAAALEQKGLNPNVDFYAATVYHMLGIPTDLMTPIFALARMAGWTAHVREQYVDNRIIRPGSVYVGPTDRRWSPIAAR